MKLDLLGAGIRAAVVILCGVMSVVVSGIVSGTEPIRIVTVAGIGIVAGMAGIGSVAGKAVTGIDMYGFGSIGIERVG